MFGAAHTLFSSIRSSVWPAPMKQILVAILIVLLLLWHGCVYELLPCTQSHEPAANILYLIHVINPQRDWKALSRGDKGRGLLWGDENESAHDFICRKPIFRQVSWLKGIRNVYMHRPERKCTASVALRWAAGLGFCSLNFKQLFFFLSNHAVYRLSLLKIISKWPKQNSSWKQMQKQCFY